MKKVILLALVLAMQSVFAVQAADVAGDYPRRSVRFIVPFVPGAGTDLTTRTVAKKLTETHGQQFIADNRAGAAGSIGADIAAKANPDGYTICLISSGHTVLSATNDKLPYDLEKDLHAVSQVSTLFYVLTVNPSFPAKTVKELIAYAKAKPGTLNFPSAGVGSSSHLAGEMLKSLAGISMVHIPFKGGGPALVAVIAGEVQIMFATMPAAMPHVKSGKVKPVAVTTAKRSQAMPELPTIAESGVKGYEASTWYGLLAPARTPPAIVTRLHAHTVKILAGPTRQRLEAQGFEPEGGTPAEFAAYIKTEIVKWAKVIKDAGIPAE